MAFGNILRHISFIACVTGVYTFATNSANFVLEKTERTSCNSSGSYSAASMSNCSQTCLGKSDCVSFLYSKEKAECQPCTTTGSAPSSPSDHTYTYGRKVFTDCSDIAADFTGYLLVRPQTGQKRFFVYCDEGWIILQRRFDGSLDFKRNWADYKDGFGSLDGELWLGNENIYLLTNQAQYRLKYEMTRTTDDVVVREHDQFSIADESQNYKIDISQALNNVNAHTSMYQINGQPFTATDRDNDSWGGNCAVTKSGGWWHQSCAWVGINYYYPTNGNCPFTDKHHCMKFKGGDGNAKLLKSSVMKIQKV